MYLLFCYYGYYPGGGWRDFVGAFDNFEMAYNHMINHQTEDFADIVNIKMPFKVKQYERKWNNDIDNPVYDWVEY